MTPPFLACEKNYMSMIKCPGSHIWFWCIVRNFAQCFFCLEVYPVAFPGHYFIYTHTYIYIYISGLARPQGRPPNKKNTKQISSLCTKTKCGCQDTLSWTYRFFGGLKKGGSRGLIQTKLGTLFSTHALPTLAKFGQISFSRT